MASASGSWRFWHLRIISARFFQQLVDLRRFLLDQDRAKVPPPHRGRRLPLLRTVHVPCVLPSLPRWDRRLRVSLASPATAAFPVLAAGRLPRCVFRGLLNVPSRCGPHGPLTPYGAFSRSASGHSSPPDPPRVLPAGARVCRPGFPPGRTVHLGKAHARSNETLLQYA